MVAASGGALAKMFGRRYNQIVVPPLPLPTAFEPQSMPQEAQLRPYEIADFSEITGTACPCGTARRAFGDVEDFPGTIHVTEISAAAKLHYHKRLTETYYFLECQAGAQMQLNDDVIDVRPGMCVMIRPGVRHRAIGKMKVLIVVFPKFDPNDEWIDEAESPHSD